MKDKPVPKYRSSNPDAQIIGQALHAILESSQAEEMGPLLPKYGLENPDPEKWYSLNNVLEFYREVAHERNSMSNLVAVGVEVFETAILPPEIDSIEAGMDMMNAIRDLNMKNAPEHESYTIEKVGPTHLRVQDRTPFPHDLVYGYMYGICKRLKPEGARPIVVREYLRPDDPDADGAIYDIQW